MFKIYDTLTQKKKFIKANNFDVLKIYVCGVTVYDYCHIGHARVFVFFDSFIRYLRFLGLNVIYVRNITDVDDKIILKSKKSLISFDKLVFFFINTMKSDFKSLNLLKPIYEPRVIFFINYIVNFINVLKLFDFSYKSSTGDLYYFVNKYLNYGNVSNRDLLNKIDYTRQNTDKVFKNFLYDFVLWKVSNIYRPYWNSFFGYGRPGWHIECSVMSMYYLGDCFNIHGGGLDLIFPHHENECAQSESITGLKYSDIWVHVGFIEINGLKMSKSFKNSVYISSLLEKYNHEIIRYFILSSHYRTPLEFLFCKLEHVKKNLIKFYLIFYNKYYFSSVLKNSIFERKFFYSINNDFNVIECFSIFFDILYEINNIKNYSLYKFYSLIRLLKNLGNIIGFFYFEVEVFLQSLIKIDKEKLFLSDEEIDELVLDRSIARLNCDWKKADFIRNYLFSFRIILEDNKYETIWKKF